MQVNRHNAWPNLIALSLGLAFVTACTAGPIGPVPAPPGVIPAGTSPAGSQAPSGSPVVVGAGFSGQALIGTKPLALATVYVHDALANKAPVAPGTGNGLQVEFAPGTYVTDAQGRFTIPLALKPGQVAYIYVTNGVQAMSALVSGNMTTYRGAAAPTPINAANPFKVDTDSTMTAGVMLGTLASFGKAATKTPTKDAAKLTLIAKAIDAMAGAAGKTTFKLQGLTKGKDVAESLATRMLKADPRRKAGPKPVPLKKKPAVIKTKAFGVKAFHTKDDDPSASDPGAAMGSLAGTLTETSPDGAKDIVTTCANASEDMQAEMTSALGSEGGELANDANSSISTDSAEQDAEMAEGATEGAPDLAGEINDAASDASGDGPGGDAGNTTGDAPADAGSGDTGDSGGDDPSAATAPGSSITVTNGSQIPQTGTLL